MLFRISAFWWAVLAGVLYVFIQFGRKRSDATGWDIADLVITLLVAIYALGIAITSGRRRQFVTASLYGAAGMFLFWSSWDLLHKLQGG